MIIDTSAMVAMLLGESEMLAFTALLDSAPIARISAATFLELCIVIDRRENPAISNRIEEILEEFDIAIEPVTPEQARIARQAYRDYGKGSGHPANLNFGDCFTYALTRTKREPLLYKGDDFIHTDIRSAV